MTTDEEEESSSEMKHVSYANLPNKRQLALLCLARIADPLAQNSIQVRLPPI